jgi:hypothetical protein
MDEKSFVDTKIYHFYEYPAERMVKWLFL